MMDADRSTGRRPSLPMAASLACLGMAVAVWPSVAAADALSPDSLALPAYRSVFEGHLKDADPESMDWRAANEKVDRIGGWRTYVREAQQPVDPLPTQPGPKASPASGKPSQKSSAGS